MRVGDLVKSKWGTAGNVGVIIRKSYSWRPGPDADFEVAWRCGAKLWASKNDLRVISESKGS